MVVSSIRVNNCRLTGNGKSMIDLIVTIDKIDYPCTLTDWPSDTMECHQKLVDNEQEIAAIAMASIGYVDERLEAAELMLSMMMDEDA